MRGYSFSQRLPSSLLLPLLKLNTLRQRIVLLFLDPSIKFPKRSDSTYSTPIDEDSPYASPHHKSLHEVHGKFGNPFFNDWSGDDGHKAEQMTIVEFLARASLVQCIQAQTRPSPANATTMATYDGRMSESDRAHAGSMSTPFVAVSI